LFGSWFDSVGNDRVSADLHRLQELWTSAIRRWPRSRAPAALAEPA